MAVMRNSIIFGGADSADFGIYISGEGVFNAPKRAVEYIQVPGRNGAFALDQGYYENIEVTYPGFNYESDMDDFCDQLAGFRNAICSQKGYQRLSDTFHPNEYRMAVYSEGLEIEPMKYNTASNFKLKFNCKPQRYLTSGETELTVTSGQTINNPTLFDSSPLLAVKGYGTIQFNGYAIEIENGAIGTINASDGQYASGGAIRIPIGDYTGMYNSTDQISILVSYFGTHLYATNTSEWYFSTTTASTFVTEAVTGSPSATPTVTQWSRDGIDWGMQASIPRITFNANANFGRKAVGRVISTIPLVNSGGNTATMTLTTNIEVEYIQNDSINVYITASKSSSADISYIVIAGMSGRGDGNTGYVRYASIASTVDRLGDPTYIDCDLGEAYMIKDGTYIGLNSFIDLGSDLPTLATGNNTVAFDNTITQLKIVPRWWQI